MTQNDIKQLRNNLSLDFTLGPSQSKKIKHQNFLLETPDIAKIIFPTESNLGPHVKKIKQENCILRTPDLAKIALTTPELDNLAMKSFQIQTSFLQSFNCKEEQEEKPKIIELGPFNIRLSTNRSKTDDAFIGNNAISLSNKSNVDQMEPEELGHPINMADQERIKLERKRYRNRIAASKCRQRKLERISKLQDKVEKLTDKNKDLNNFIQAVQDIVNKLNNHICTHKKMGCDIREIRF